MSSTTNLSPVQRRLLSLSRSYGTRAGVTVITVWSLVASWVVTGASFLFGTTTTEVMVTAMIVATIVPLVVAPVASSVIISLAHSLAVAHDELHVLATTDTLTGIANRRRFFDDAAALSATRPSGTLLLAGMVDIDQFKQLNDRDGHATGDGALVMLARRLNHAAAGYGVVGRLGGDEFGVFLAVPDDVLMVVTSALQAACDSIEVEPGRSISASIGLRCLDGDQSVDAAMQLADTALYSVKASRAPINAGYRTVDTIESRRDTAIRTDGRSATRQPADDR